MKKIVFAALLCAALLCGCAGRPAGEAAACQELAAKAQEVAVVPAGAEEPAETLSAPEDVAGFVEALGLDGWTLDALPQGSEKAGTFILSQNETTLWGQDEPSGRAEVCRITVYDQPYAELEAAGIVLTFAVPEAAASALSEYLQ